MPGYLATTDAERQEMLAALGLKTARELYSEVPPGMMLAEGLGLPAGRSEAETLRMMEALAQENTVFKTVFRGAGAYRHYIPAVVEAVAQKESLRTAYTPYQAEISQGVLQGIFEFQTMICELTGMEVANASVYDGASAAGEAIAMCRGGKRTKAVFSAAAPPAVLRVAETYCHAADCEFVLAPARDGRTDEAALAELLSDEVACVYIQQPNFFGVVEDAAGFAAAAHAAGAKLVMGVNPIAAAVLKTPGECGADIAVGEGQPLGLPLGFGGPYLGFMACTAALMRRLPGRIAGETTDAEGRRAFVLTLQAREQHIRRERAGSNICSNQALCALTAAAYMATMGPHGLADVARQSAAKAHYLAEGLAGIGFGPVYEAPFFHEFVGRCPVDAGRLLEALQQQGILGGLPVAEGLLWCTTELCTKEEIDRLVRLVGEVAA